MKKCIYVGAFIDRKELLAKVSIIRKDRLAKAIEDPHVTFAFKPKTIDESLFGEKIRIKVVGYGNDGKNEGLRVKLETKNPALSAMTKEISVPHITVSVSADGKPVDTAKLRFSPLDKPFFLDGVFGAFTPDGVVTEKEK